MKKNSVLSCLFVAALVTSVNAMAAESIPSETVTLPTYVVAATRETHADDGIDASLAALRAEASKPVHISVELPAIRMHAMRNVPATRLARS